MTDTVEKEMYTARVSTSGGRGGRAASDDGLIDFPLARPGQGTATNPEQLLAAGWGACFQSALEVVAKGTGVSAEDSVVCVHVTLGATSSGLYALKSRIEAYLPGVEIDVAQQLVEKTHAICPYSLATRGNIEATVSAVTELEMYGR